MRREVDPRISLGSSDRIKLNIITLRVSYYQIGTVPVTLLSSKRDQLEPVLEVRASSPLHAEYKGEVAFLNIFQGELPAGDWPKINVCPRLTSAAFLLFDLVATLTSTRPFSSSLPSLPVLHGSHRALPAHHHRLGIPLLQVPKRSAPDSGSFFARFAERRKSRAEHHLFCLAFFRITSLELSSTSSLRCLYTSSTTGSSRIQSISTLFLAHASLN